MIIKVDKITEYIQNKLIETKLENRINVIYLSDHGMNNVPTNNYISLTEFSNGLYDTYGSSPTIQIVPVDSSECKNFQFFIMDFIKYFDFYFGSV